MNLFSWYWSFCLVAGVLYTALMVWFLNGWKSILVFKRQQKTYHTKVSIIVPFFNEAATLKNCIEGLVHQNIQTTEIEILLLDDQSTDESVAIAKKQAEKSNRIKYYRNEQKGKKQALIQGISVANGDLIVTTDADCIHPEFWLANLVEYYELHSPNMIVGPVNLQAGNSFFQKFQQIEFVSLIASGAGAVGIEHPIMCNGANLAFNKSQFLKLDDPLKLEFESGDDVFLLHSMKKIGADKIHFLKSAEAMVTTAAKKELKSFLNQRFRWVSKAPGYSDGDTKFTAFVVFISSFLWVFGLVMLPFNPEFWKPIVYLFLLKTLVDMFFLSQVSEFFKQKKLINWIPLFQFVYGFYVIVSALSLVFLRKKVK